MTAALAFAALAVLLMWPVLGAPHQRVYGEPSDPLGEVWRLEQFRTGEIGLVGDTVAMTANAPDGVQVRRAVDATQILYDLPAWALVKVVPAVPAYNLLVWTAIWSAGLAAFWALRRLGVRWEGAAAGGLLFTIAPVHMVEAQLHVGLAFVAPLPVLLAFGVEALRRPSARRGALFGALAGGCAYVTAYLALEALALAAGVTAAAGAAYVADRRQGPALARAAGAAAAASLVVVAPLLVVLRRSREALDAAVTRPADDVAAFSLSPGDYVDPRASSYIGLVGVTAALAGLVWGRGGRTLRATLAAVAISGAWVSLSPDAPIVGVAAPGEWIHAALPYWRVYGRTEVVAALAVACLSALAVARASERPGRLGRLAAVGIVAAAAVDVVRAPPPAAADVGLPDPAAAWLAGARGAVAEYPLRGFDDYRLGPYLLRQTRHGRPLMNGSVAGSRSAELAEAAGAADGVQARSALVVAGVDRVIVNADATAPAPPGLTPGPPLGDGARGWLVPGGDAAVALARSAYAVEPGPDGSQFRWLGEGAVVRVHASCPGRARVSLTAVSHSAARRARIGTSTVAVGTSPTRARIVVRVGPDGTADVPVSTRPAPSPLPGGDPRVAGIGVYGLSAAISCVDGDRTAIG